MLFEIVEFYFLRRIYLEYKGHTFNSWIFISGNFLNGIFIEFISSLAEVKVLKLQMKYKLVKEAF